MPAFSWKLPEPILDFGGGLPNLFGGIPGERMPPAQARKLFIVAVGGNPFAAGLNGKGGKPDIGNQIARGRK